MNDNQLILNELRAFFKSKKFRKKTLPKVSAKNNHTLIIY